MNIYLLSQNVNNGYDTYDSMIIIAESKENAIKLSIKEKGHWAGYNSEEDINIKRIGISGGIDQDEHIVLASFNAG